ncbi:hypothetical protein KI387_008862, partial [Taxus chinensis]
FRVQLEEAIEGVNFVPPIQVVRADGLSLEEAHRVISALSIRIAELMKFVSK